MRDKEIHDVLSILREEYKKWKLPAVTRVARRKDPFRVLVSTLISLRTKDEVTDDASKKLFRIADTPESMVKIPARDIEKAIYPAGFYRTKAKNIKRICSIILDKYHGKVPDTIDELLTLPGVGRKTANLVVTLGYGKPGICVDTHVHRVSNRLGYVSTKTPDKTEFALRDKLPPEYWIEYNDLLVTYGKYICTPVSPFCSKCQLYRLCSRVGVTRTR
ncbi:MAG: endonuclease III [Spirochaetota bacterium]|nr:MAG: endonuclease III [Spirochaetota bacterium]